jgi:hypothetical protein
MMGLDRGDGSCEATPRTCWAWRDWSDCGRCSWWRTPVRALQVTLISCWVTLRARWVTLRARWGTLRACWVTVRARWVTLRARWVTLRARWGTLRARWVTLRARWGTLRARWVTVRARWGTLRACWVTLTARWVTLTSRWVALIYSAGLAQKRLLPDVRRLAHARLHPPAVPAAARQRICGGFTGAPRHSHSNLYRCQESAREREWTWHANSSAASTSDRGRFHHPPCLISHPNPQLCHRCTVPQGSSTLSTLPLADHLSRTQAGAPPGSAAPVTPVTLHALACFLHFFVLGNAAEGSLDVDAARGQVSPSPPLKHTSPLPTLGTKRTTPPLIPTVDGNTVRSFSTHGQQSAAKGSSTAASRSDIRLIQSLDSSALGLVRRWL